MAVQPQEFPSHPSHTSESHVASRFIPRVVGGTALSHEVETVPDFVPVSLSINGITLNPDFDDVGMSYAPLRDPNNPPVDFGGLPGETPHDPLDRIYKNTSQV